MIRGKLQNWSLSIPPNQVVDYTAQYPNSGGIPIDISVLSVFPHMHLLGQTIKAYAVDPQGDTVKFVNVPHWDFHWQDFYFFRHIQKAPAGSVIKGEATYDNTVNNEHNPSNPPVWVTAGESTTDEMFMVYFHYLYYQPGDELYDLESMMNVGLTELSNANNPNRAYMQMTFTSLPSTLTRIGGTETLAVSWTNAAKAAQPASASSGKAGASFPPYVSPRRTAMRSGPTILATTGSISLFRQTAASCSAGSEALAALAQNKQRNIC